MRDRWLDGVAHAGDEHVDRPHAAGCGRKPDDDPAGDAAVPARHGPGRDTTAVDLSAGNVHVLLAACLWGTTGTVRTYVPAATNLSIAAIRLALGGLLLMAVEALTARGAGLRRLLGAPRNWLLLVPGSLAAATYQAAFFSAAARTGVAIGTVVTIGSAPAFAGALAAASGRTPRTGRWLLATAGAIAGCAALVGGGEATGADPVGIGLALLSGLSYALYATIVAALVSRGEQDRAVTAALFGVAAGATLPVLLSGGTAWALTGRGAIIALYLGGVATAGGYLLFGRGLRTTPAATATTLTLAEPAVATLLGVALLGERMGRSALAGLVLVAVSLAVLILPGRPARRQPGRVAAGRRDRSP